MVLKFINISSYFSIFLKIMPIKKWKTEIKLECFDKVKLKSRFMIPQAALICAIVDKENIHKENNC